MACPELWIVAGPNGAGKTTLVQAHPIQQLLPQVPFLNPDDVARELLMRGGYTGFSDAPEPVQRRAFLEAARLVEARLEAAVQRQKPVGVETVLSSDKYRPLVERVRARNGFVGLIYVTVVSPEVSCRRVARRVRAGGHDVPVEKVQARWHRSLSNLAWFAARASAFWVFDNSDERPDVPPRLVATGRRGVLETLDPSAGDELLASLSTLPRTSAR